MPYIKQDKKKYKYIRVGWRCPRCGELIKTKQTKGQFTTYKNHCVCGDSDKVQRRWQRVYVWRKRN